LKAKVYLQAAVFIIISLSISCKDKNDSVSGFGQIKVYTKSLSGSNPVRAYIFLNDSLFGKTGENGIYLKDSINPGNYHLICSAINFHDTSLDVVISSGNITELEFRMTVDTTLGQVYGEFQDMTLFRQKAIDKPVMNTWDERMVYDATTGATIFKLGPQTGVPARNVSLDDSIIAVADGFGMYVFKIQSGTYQIKGSREGYADALRVIKVLPGSNNCVNLFLEKQ
jgi:hypothetical protein